jgi:hypothetical protein
MIFKIVKEICQQSVYTIRPHKLSEKDMYFPLSKLSDGVSQQAVSTRQDPLQSVRVRPPLRKLSDGCLLASSRR